MVKDKIGREVVLKTHPFSQASSSDCKQWAAHSQRTEGPVTALHRPQRMLDRPGLNCVHIVFAREWQGLA